MAEKRMAVAQAASLLEPNPAILEIAKLLLEPAGPLPRKVEADALHVASATLYGCDYLLTWNFKHLANAIIERHVERILRTHGYEPPTVCTPDELRGGLAGG